MKRVPLHKVPGERHAGPLVAEAVVEHVEAEPLQPVEVCLAQHLRIMNPLRRCRGAFWIIDALSEPGGVHFSLAPTPPFFGNSPMHDHCPKPETTHPST